MDRNLPFSVYRYLHITIALYRCSIYRTTYKFTLLTLLHFTFLFTTVLAYKLSIDTKSDDVEWLTLNGQLPLSVVEVPTVCANDVVHAKNIYMDFSDKRQLKLTQHLEMVMADSITDPRPSLLFCLFIHVDETWCNYPEQTMGQRVMGHGSRVKWVEKCEWVTLVTGHYLKTLDPWSVEV